MYLLAASLTAALPAERRVLARRGWAGETPGPFEHPEVILALEITVPPESKHDGFQEGTPGGHRGNLRVSRSRPKPLAQ